MLINLCLKASHQVISAAANLRHQTLRASPLTVLSLYCIALTFAAPLSSVYTEYVYNYEASIVFNGNPGIRFTAKAHLDVLYAVNGDSDSGGDGPSVTQTTSGPSISNGQIVRLRLTEPKFYTQAASSRSNDITSHAQLNELESTPLMPDGKQANLYNPDHDIYAHIVTLTNGTAYIKQLFTHQADVSTFKNIKKSILLNLLPTNNHLKPILGSHTHSSDSNSDGTDNYLVISHDNNRDQPELFSPDSLSQIRIIAKPHKQTLSTSKSTTTSSPSDDKPGDQPAIGSKYREGFAGPAIFQAVEGYQNVTFRSRVFSQAESNLTTTFKLDLVEELKSSSHKELDSAGSLASALKLLLNDKKDYQPDTVALQRERRVCSVHHCGKSLLQLYKDYKSSLEDESLASVEASVAFLRILDSIRDSRGTSANDILKVLKSMRGNKGVQSSFLDILAAARTKDSINAAFKHIRLAANDDLDTAERFLSVISVAAKTASKMHLDRKLMSPYYFNETPPLKRDQAAKTQSSRMASLEFIAQELMNIIEQTPSKRWASQKLRWSSLLTLGTLVNANNQEHNYESEFINNDSLNHKVNKLFLEEIEACDTSDTDCRIVILQAIGNVGNFGIEQFKVLRNHVLDSGRRESIAAMKVLRDLLQNQAKDKELNEEFYTSLKDLLLRVVYDNNHETTARVLAAELIVRFVPNSLASDELLHNLPSFGNNELATMIYSRILSLRPDSSVQHNQNWYWKSCIINGTSTSFVRQMAKTESLNASYGVNVELLKGKKMLKESSFDVFLDTKERTQDLFSLGIFARGLSSFSGAPDDGSEDSNESSMAGMTLRLLGGYLRPYVFFTSAGELIGHIWSGTASEPTTAFNGNLLLIDHQEGYPLISGFVAEQLMRGVLSIDVTGKVKASLWKRSSHSVVRTKASVTVQASQSVFTSYDRLWRSHLFSFGGQAMIDFVADVDFASSPSKICLQVTQPEFMIRYNVRNHDQLMNSDVTRRITRRNLYVGAKSYSLNNENNKMCSEMNDEL